MHTNASPMFHWRPIKENSFGIVDGVSLRSDDTFERLENVPWIKRHISSFIRYRKNALVVSRKMD